MNDKNLTITINDRLSWQIVSEGPLQAAPDSRHGVDRALLDPRDGGWLVATNGHILVRAPFEVPPALLAEYPLGICLRVKGPKPRDGEVLEIPIPPVATTQYGTWPHPITVLSQHPKGGKAYVVSFGRADDFPDYRQVISTPDRGMILGVNEALLFDVKSAIGGPDPSKGGAYVMVPGGENQNLSPMLVLPSHVDPADLGDVLKRRIPMGVVMPMRVDVPRDTGKLNKDKQPVTKEVLVNGWFGPAAGAVLSGRDETEYLRGRLTETLEKLEAEQKALKLADHALKLAREERDGYEGDAKALRAERDALRVDYDRVSEDNARLMKLLAARDYPPAEGRTWEDDVAEMARLTENNNRLNLALMDSTVERERLAELVKSLQADLDRAVQHMAPEVAPESVYHPAPEPAPDLAAPVCAMDFM